jgi:hypothetical protein
MFLKVRKKNTVYNLLKVFKTENPQEHCKAENISYVVRERETRETLDLTAATTLLGLNRGTRSDLNSGLGSLLCLYRSASHSIFDLLCHGQESLFDVGGVLG